MINKINVKNFKSIADLSLSFGRINLFIGENGSGKSTILEAIAFASAAEAGKLDAEFLENRGIRVTHPKLMRSQFSDDENVSPIVIELTVDDACGSRKYKINNENETYSEWKIETESKVDDDDVSLEEIYQKTSEYKLILDMLKTPAFIKLKDNFGKDDKEFQAILDEVTSKDFLKKVNRVSNYASATDKALTAKLSMLHGFVIYTPQYKQLLWLMREGAVRPLGIYGEGLFTLIKEITNKQQDALSDIEDGLRLIGWYDSMQLESPDISSGDGDVINIKDKYLSCLITQKSANEGFLYVLFYLAAIVSSDTPKIFAIDNIDTALNPKLCAKIMSYIAFLAKKYDKQIFLTTQNPATLDGLNLDDDEQKLFIASRKRNGSTTIKEFPRDKAPKNKSGDKIRLSEAMIRGYIGGLPKGF
ncbi:hypothetical protein RF11_03934 [Thelohanellus kitauei]|uniref:Uncharacterized protein n=1 Tax=Thelohanellus kitauei TaxID=669202 RepID=A0A0C2MMN6_THEKT|nr:MULTISPECIES: AAA family ATPase [Aeromonas]KII62911.1 hypothetical protein RF11_03934 [Thelohanellus kitauei]MDX7807684.1 AAA family ATPase [Aeromonas caviae]